jgi:hypothetical protein
MTLRPSSLYVDPLLYTVGSSSHRDTVLYAAATASSAACAAASSTNRNKGRDCVIVLPPIDCGGDALGGSLVSYPTAKPAATVLRPGPHDTVGQPHIC